MKKVQVRRRNEDRSKSTVRNVLQENYNLKAVF